VSSSDKLDGQRGHLRDGDVSNPCPTGAPLLTAGTTCRNPPDPPCSRCAPRTPRARIRRSRTRRIPAIPGLQATPETPHAPVTQCKRPPSPADDPPSHLLLPGPCDLRRLWDATRDWRLRGIEGAKKLTQSLGGTGLRRAEVWNSLGHWLEILDKGESYNKPSEFIQAIRTLKPQYAEWASFIVNITNICYQLNQAGGLELRGSVSEPNVPKVLSRSAATVIPSLTVQESWPIPAQVFDHTIKVPKVSAMLKADSIKLLEVREGEQGLSYRHYRSEWIIDPSDENADDLRRAADHYAAAIRNRVKGAQENTRIVQLSNAGHTVIGGAVGSMVGGLGSLVTPHPEYALIVSLAGAGEGASAVVKNVTKPATQNFKIEIRSNS